MKTIVGIRPTGKLHIGHYFSVIKPALEEKADVLIARYHAPNSKLSDVKFIKRQLLSFGINPVVQTINGPLYFKLLSVSKLGELERMTQYKSSEDRTPHLLIYPILMAHDLYGYDKVVVGEDQRQHVEYANVLFKKLGLPKIIADYRGGRIMSLKNPLKKMSKSDPSGCLFLDDSTEDIKRKIYKAQTTPEGVMNLSYISKQFGVEYEPLKNKESKDLLIQSIINTFKK